MQAGLNVEDCTCLKFLHILMIGSSDNGAQQTFYGYQMEVMRDVQKVLFETSYFSNHHKIRTYDNKNISSCDMSGQPCKHSAYSLTLLHSEWPKLCGVLTILSAIGLNGTILNVFKRGIP